MTWTRLQLKKRPVGTSLALLLALHGALLIWSAKENSAVVGEVSHLCSGLSHLCLGHFDLFRVNPPLVRVAAALPVVLLSPGTDWRRYDTSPLKRSENGVSRDFLTVNGVRSLWFLTVARWACVPFSIFGGYMCFRWGYTLYGIPAGFLASILWCSCPYVLGHAALLTTDAHAAAMGVAAGYTFWRWLAEPCWDRALFAGLVLGLAQLTKFTLLVFYPLWLVMWLLYRLPEYRQMWSSLWWREVRQLLLLMVFSVFIINVGYGFEGSFQRLRYYRFQTQTMTGRESWVDVPAEGGNRFDGTWFGALPVPLPKNYVQGIDAQKFDFEHGLRSYLHGKWKMDGWWYYYLYALTIKIPLGTWAVFLLAVGASFFVQGYSVARRDEMVLLLPALVILLVVSSQTGFSIHSRYILPMLPFAFVWMSKVGRCIQLRQSEVTILVGVALCWSVGSSLWYYPHSLSYFNELVGGPKGGHAHLLDSNIAWGQDLYFLKHWYDEHPSARPFHLAYYGVIDPSLVGMDVTLPLVGPTSGTSGEGMSLEEMGPLPGWYAVDMNHLHGTKVPSTDGQGGWRSVAGEGYDLTYFQEYRPVAMAGYSIYIYHITLDEANRVRRKLHLVELPKDWRPQQESDPAR